MLLVRHGESTWNAERRWQGRADPPLTKRGEDQARRAVPAAAHARAPTSADGFDLVVTSTLQRARRTGELLGRGLGIELGRSVDGLAERDAGPWQGLTRAQIHERYPGFLDDDLRPDGYEGDDSVVSRAVESLADLAAERPERSMLVISHGGVIHALERQAQSEWRRLGNLEGRWFEVDPLAGAVVAIGDRVALIPDGAPPDLPAAYA